MPKTILITGANGRIGTALVDYIDALGESYDLRLADLEISNERGMKIDVVDLDYVLTPSNYRAQ